ncbi:MAG TPA: YkgJ family cysteine cluster protein [Usitatibacter sp.]|nr:YkgJ family cysteine cluster protein [Usitatibacter sp.]
MKNGKPFPIPVRVKSAKPAPKYSCAKCPGYCCTYSEIEVKRRDVERLAKHFGIGYRAAEERFTKTNAKGVMMMRHRKDSVFDSICAQFDQEKRRCTVYEARPSVCRAYPAASRCGYYDFLKFEREQQGDEELVALT